MPRRCTVCISPDRSAIDLMMINLQPYRSMMDRYTTLSKGALIRHHDHLGETLAKARAAEEAAKADDLLKHVQAMLSKAITLMQTAERDGDIRTALAGVREWRATVELLAELEQRIDRRPVVNIWLTPEWQTIEAALVGALASFPAARLAVVERLNHLRAV